MKNEWPFIETRNALVYSTRNVIEKGKPILLVIHDQYHGAWQFYSEKTESSTDARIAALGEIIFHDPSIVELADLPRGWIAVRDSIIAPWKRHPIDNEDGNDELAV
jgi:hypothetical protein